MVRNRSFTVPQSIVSMYQLEEYARPMVGRSVQVNSLCFTKRDWKANVASEAKAHLLVFTPDAKKNVKVGLSHLSSILTRKMKALIVLMKNRFMNGFLTNYQTKQVIVIFDSPINKFNKNALRPQKYVLHRPCHTSIWQGGKRWLLVLFASA